MSREKPVRVVVLRTAGTNCDVETAYAFEKVGAEVERIHVNRLAENRRGLDRFHVLALPGGFSYGDDIASGKVLANEIRYRMEDEIRRFVADGKLIIGICNGFQVLVKAGLLPRLRGDKVEATLTVNDRALFEDRWVHLRVEESPCVFVRPGDALYLPVAHGEGKFIAEKGVLAEIVRKKLVVARYVGPNGGSNPGYPWNPNGSLSDIAGICDPTGRIFGLMPHPERHVEPTQHPRWTREEPKSEGDGLKVFRNTVDFARRNLT
jgi:phosphoribosylformylglycinamidine synthase subunit PurQ / glutaminase